MGRLRLQLPNLGVVGGRAEVVIVLQKRHQMKLAVDSRKMKFRPASSAAGPELGDYTQWVRLRAPTREAKKIIRRKRAKETYADGSARLQVGLVAAPKGLPLRPELGLDVK